MGGAFDQNQQNVAAMFGPQANAPAPGAAPRAPNPRAPAPPAPGQSPDVAAVAQMHAGLWDGTPQETLQRLFPGGMSPQQQAFQQAYAAAQASDGIIDQAEGQNLRTMAHTAGTDQLSMLQSMYLRGHDPAQVTALYERLRATDAAQPGDPTATHQDQNGANLANPANLSPEELRLWRETQMARFDDMQGGTQMRKVVDQNQANEIGTGVRGSPGSPSVSNSVGGFVSMAAHTQDQTAPQALATTGLDSAYHARPDINMFSPSPTNPGQQGQFSPAVQTQGIPTLNFPLTAPMQQNMQVPMGSFAQQQMQAESQRRMNNTVTTADGRTLQEYVPELLQPQRDASGAVQNDAAGLPQLPHVRGMNREVSGNTANDQANPFTGWGFSSTRRATDASGAAMPVIPNQELVMGGRAQIPAGSTLTQQSPTSSAQAPIAHMPAGGTTMVPSTGASPAALAGMQAHLTNLRPGQTLPPGQAPP
jgi:hypothetical protein